jgi:hypothetical protein
VGAGVRLGFRNRENSARRIRFTAPANSILSKKWSLRTSRGGSGNDNSQHVNYIGTDNHIHELYIHPGNPWVDNDLTTLA